MICEIINIVHSRGMFFFVFEFIYCITCFRSMELIKKLLKKKKKKKCVCVPVRVVYTCTCNVYMGVCIN